MKVILIKDVSKLGEANSVVNVAPGYARNFLIPRDLAVPATDEALKTVEKKRKKTEELLAAEKGKKEEVKKQLESLSFSSKVEAGESGKLFGAVTSQDIADILREQANVAVDKRKVLLDDPIKSLGDHEVSIELHPEVVAKIKVTVEAK